MDIEKLSTELLENKKQQKMLSSREEILKNEILSYLKQNDVKTIKLSDGTITLTEEHAWKYTKDTLMKVDYLKQKITDLQNTISESVAKIAQQIKDVQVQDEESGNAIREIVKTSITVRTK